ncbi:MAG: AsmA-like C-terminal region-containing protein, partial [Burkholderiales bacterium]
STATHLTTKSFNFSVMAEQNGLIQIAKKKVELQNAKFNLANHLRGEVNWAMDKSAKLAYHGNLTLTDFSLVKICDILNVTWPRQLFNQPFQHLALFTGIQGDKENISLSNLHLKVGDSQLQGSLVVSATDYFNLRENLSLDQVDIADFIDLDGFKLKVESATVIGNITGDAKINLTRLNGKEQIYMKKLTLYGLDLNKFSAEVNKAINSMSGLKKLTATREAEAALKYIRQTIEKISNLRQKNYAEKTNLGRFKANLLIKSGFVTTPRFELVGPNLNTTGKGKINLNQQTLNYLLTSQIISPNPPTVINYLYFPFTCKGSFSQMDTGFEWNAILGQLLPSFAAKHQDKYTFKKAY